MLRTLLLRFAGLFHKRRRDADTDEELRAHLEMLAQENIERGMSPEKAHRTARIALGGADQIKEAVRDQRGLPFIESFLADIRFSLRMLRKNLGFTIVAVLTLALGIAGAVAIFGFVDAALIRPLPYPDLSRLMGVFETSPLGGQRNGYSYPNYLDLQRSNTVFASIAAYEGENFVLSDSGSVHLVNGIGVTGGFFRILRVTPILGRDFVDNPADEDLLSAPSTAILSYAAWQKWFNGSPDVLGKAVTLNEQSYRVIGVLPRSFEFAPAGAAEFWTTLRPYAGDSCQLSRGCMVMGVIARLKSGVTIRQALDDVRAIAAREAREHPDPDRNRGANIVPLSQVILDDIQPILLALLGGVALLLLIAYVNVTGLLLSRSENRRREFAVRGALGAGRGRLVQQFVTEALVMVAVSGALGLSAATFARQLLLKLIPIHMLNSMPYLRGTGWNRDVTAFSIVLVLIAWTLFVIAPVLRLPFANLRVGMAEGGRGTAAPAWRHLGAKLVVVELATTMVLLAAAGLLGKSVYKLLHVDFGFVPGHLATLWILAPESKYSNADQAIALQREIVARIESLPGVTGAGMTNDLPVTGVPSTQIGFVGKPSLSVNNEVGHRWVSAGYLPVLQATLLKGRYFNQDDNANAPLVAIVNQTLARRYFPDENPIGKQFFYHAHDITQEASQPPIQIVGVIADVKEYALDRNPLPIIYTPFEQGSDTSFCIAVRTAQDAGSVLPSLIAAIHEIDSEIVTSAAATMPQIIQDSPAAYLHRASAWLVGGFAALALALSAVGLYGVIAYSVSQRTREIGVRMALGAQRSSVYSLILREAGWLILFGIVIGLSGSVAAGIFMRSLLFGVRSWDVSILVGVAAVLVVSALLASWIPARRAARVDPMVALRYE